MTNSSFSDTERLSRALENVELVISHDLFMNESIRQHAHVVLPGTAWLEQLGCKMTNTHIYLVDKILSAPEHVLTLSQILQTLAKRFGLNDFYPWENDEGYINAILDHDATQHATVASLRENDGRQEMAISHVAYPDLKFPTPSGKIEFYSEQAKEAGLSPLPIFSEGNLSEDYPLQFRQGRTLKHFHGFYDHGRALPSLDKYSQQAELWVSETDAEARSIDDGQKIRIENERGSMHAIAKVTSKIQSGTVWMRDGWSDINKLTSGEACLPDSALDLFPFSVGQATYEANVEIIPLN